MNIHRHFGVSACAAIPEGHLLQTTFLFYLSHWLSPNATVCLSRNAETQRIYPSINLCMWRILSKYVNIYSLETADVCTEICRSRKCGLSFVIHISWWLLHGPFALKLTSRHGLPAISMYESFKKNLTIHHYWMYKIPFFCLQFSPALWRNAGQAGASCSTHGVMQHRLSLVG